MIASDPSSPEQVRSALSGLLADPGAASLENLLEQIEKLDRLRSLKSSTTCSSTSLPALSRRIASGWRWSRRMNCAACAPLRLTLLAAFGLLRKRELTDGLVDLLVARCTASPARPSGRFRKNG